MNILAISWLPAVERDELLAVGGPGSGCESKGAPGVGGQDRSSGAAAAGVDGRSGRGAEPGLIISSPVLYQLAHR